MTRLLPAATLGLLLAALLACKSKGNVTGSVVLDGASFRVEDCQVSESTTTSGGSTTTSQVTLIDPAKRRLSFSNSGGMKVYLSSGASSFEDLGSGCGKLTVSGSVKTDPGSVKGHVDADCTGGGHKVKASFDYAGCGTYGLKLP